MNRSAADFSYAVAGDVLKIWDLNLGNRSVTNDAENVLSKVEAAEGRSFAGFPILYRDSMGVWDRLIWDGQEVRFIPLRETSERLAFERLLKGQNHGSTPRLF
ncbi:MAG TPA: hypothetical protein VGD78_22925 [Chthoniobacterales bacterium]